VMIHVDEQTPDGQPTHVAHQKDADPSHSAGC
jgi:hypothetical protein